MSRPGGVLKSAAPMFIQQAPASSAMVMSTKLTSSRFKDGRVEGQRLTGRFALAKVGEFGEMGSSQNCLVAFGDVTATPAVYIGLNPVDIFAPGSRELYETLPFAQFKFKQFRIIYVSQVPTTDTNSVAIAYYPDPDVANSIDDDKSAYDQLITSPNSLAFPAWTSGVVLDMSDQLTQNWFYVDGTFGDSRFTEQGLVWVQLSSNDGKDGQKGLLYVDYQLDMIEPRFVDAAASSLESKTALKKAFGLNRKSLAERVRDKKRAPAPAENEQEEEGVVVERDRQVQATPLPVVAPLAQQQERRQRPEAKERRAASS
jgi:hypothetical protein